MTHDVSLTYSRFEHMPPSAVALALLLHVGVGLALFWISPLRPVDHFEDAIEISMDAPEAVTPVAEQKTEPAPEPAAAPASPPPPPPAPAASAPTPTPQPVTPPMRLGLPPPPAERSTNPRDVAGAETPAPRATDMPTPDTVKEEGPKEESKPAESKPEEPKPQEAKQEPPPQQQALAQPEPPAPQPPAIVQPEPPPPPQQQALAKPEPPPPPPPPSLEQALPPLDAPPPPVTERDVPKPPPAPRAAPPPPPPQQAARPAPPPAAPAPAQRPPPPAPPQQQLRPSPLAPHTPGGSDSRAAAQPSPAFRNPADEYGQKRAQEQYLWQVMRRIAQFPYVPKNTGVIREEGTVLTRVTISRQGELLGVVMEKSSGLPSLDAGVMDTIRRASPYPPLPADIPGDRHTFQLPVSFRYNEQR